MTSTAIAVSHMKVHGFSGDHRLERCEDVGCTVDELGNAECGRLACPGCGFSGSNLTVAGGTAGDLLARCSCGNVWIPEPRTVTIAASVAA